MATERSLDIIVGAKDQASAQIGGIMGKIGGQFTSRLLGMTGALAAVRLAFSASAIAAADMAKEQAVARGETVGILEAQLKQLDAQDDMIRQIPFIGSAIQQALSAWSDRTAIETAIKNIQEITRAGEQHHAIVLKLINEEAVARARAAGATAADIADIKQQQIAGERKATRDVLIENEQKARSALAIAIEMQTKAAETLKKRQAEARRALARPGIDPEPWDVERARKSLEAAQVMVGDQRRIYEERKADRETFQRNMRALDENERVINDAERAKQDAAVLAQDRKSAAQSLAEKNAALDQIADAGRNAEERERARILKHNLDLRALSEQFDPEHDAQNQLMLDRALTDALSEMHDRARAREKAARDREAADIKRLADEQRRKAEEVARAEAARLSDKQRLENELYNLGHTAKERELRESEQKYAQLRKDYADDAEMQKLITVASIAEKAAIEKRHAKEVGYTPGYSETQAFTSRFIRQTQRPDAGDPAWATKLTEETTLSNTFLKRIAEEAGIKVEQIGLN